MGGVDPTVAAFASEDTAALQLSDDHAGWLYLGSINTPMDAAGTLDNVRRTRGIVVLHFDVLPRICGNQSLCCARWISGLVYRPAGLDFAGISSGVFADGVLVVLSWTLTISMDVTGTDFRHHGSLWRFVYRSVGFR